MPPSPDDSGLAAVDIIVPVHPPSHHDIRAPLLSSSRSGGHPRNTMSAFFSSPPWCATPSFLTKVVMVVLCVSFTFVMPILTSLSTKLPASATSDHISFNLLVQFPESSLSLVSFLTLYSTMSSDRREGQPCHDSATVARSYPSELNRAFRHHLFIFIPSFIIEVVHKLIFISKADVSIPYIGKFLSPGLNGGIVMVLILSSWAYRTGIFLLVCMIFRVTCELQILRFLSLVNMLEGDELVKDARAVFEEHVRIRKELSSTSHRYRFFIIGCLVTVTVSLFGALMVVLGSKTKKTFLNSGDLLVCVVVELSGLFWCFMGAARITHRAQGMASVASRWHMSITSSTPPASCHSKNNSRGDIRNTTDGPVPEEDLDSDSSFRTRQALVAYLQHNNGGITLYGFALDRGLLHTIFAFEFSLVLWILSKVVVLS
ncbi:hypothetical protein MLD38_001270 [Melastoma candidum]|uniref:Uncharacterized protein n=1 Tax=Melastoma candidum TaxID=119954 RepID=A0ACB9SC61_9MYRT|nr:hypothetical protein MLD38_001270 [Melastoma candidum]